MHCELINKQLYKLQISERCVKHTVTSPSESAVLMLELSSHKDGESGNEADILESMARVDKRRSTDVVGPFT